ncbi:hypothetical protein [Puniceibacterium confluentis]|uniref:hypothetical protein n=1 Tax=Puniceibacterium confluentis TaxID=1958944 RepID=UPI0035693D06
MTLSMTLRKLACLTALLVTSACSVTPPVPDQPDAEKIAELSRAIAALRPGVDPREARRAARLAVEYPRQLAVAYEIEDSPLTHNSKVNAGLKPRGLCWHWSRDLGARLEQERFRTLDVRYAIANYKVAFRIEHSSVILTARGDPLEMGLVLDPWRYGGALYWGPVPEDTAYPWRPRDEVQAERRADEGLPPLAPAPTQWLPGAAADQGGIVPNF